MRMSPLNKKKVTSRHQRKEYGNPLLEESRELVSLDNYMVSHTETLDQYEP